MALRTIRISSLSLVVRQFRNRVRIRLAPCSLTRTFAITLNRYGEVHVCNLSVYALQYCGYKYDTTTTLRFRYDFATSVARLGLSCECDGVTLMR